MDVKVTDIVLDNSLFSRSVTKRCKKNELPKKDVIINIAMDAKADASFQTSCYFLIAISLRMSATYVLLWNMWRNLAPKHCVCTVPLTDKWNNELNREKFKLVYN